MIFQAASIQDVWLIHLERVEDTRGSFARSWCAEEFADRGLCTEIAQCGVSHNKTAGTWRGMHYQVAPYCEHKTIRVTRGAICDVVFDLRQDSPTYCHTYQVELDSAAGPLLHVPAGCAHGFLSLRDDTEVTYQLSAPYQPQAARGIRFDDPILNIRWPREPIIMSDRDRNFPSFDPQDPPL